MPSSSAPYSTSFARVTPLREIVDGVAQHQRRRQRDGRGDDDAAETDDEVAAIAEGVSQQAPKRGHEPSILPAMNALYIVLPALCILAIAYRYYSAFWPRGSWRWTTRA